MLEGLDQPDWKTLQHAYGSAEHTPDMLRLLLSTDTVERHRAHQHLAGEVHHQETFYSVTPVVVPFLIELLADEAVPQRDWIPSYFHALITACNEHLLRAVPYGGEFPIGLLRHEIDTYNQICQGIDRYIQLLLHPQPEIRLQTSKLLGEIIDQSDRSLEPVWSAIEIEQNAGVLAVLITSFAKLASQTKLSDARRSHLHNLALNHDSASVRWEAAIAFIELTMSGYFSFEMSNPESYIPSALIEMLVDGLINPQKYNLARITSPERQLRVLRMLGIKGMTRALQVEGLNAAAAHLIVRELLDTAFENRIGRFHQRSYAQTWHIFQTVPLVDQSFQLNYQMPGHHNFYIPGQTLKRQQKQAIAAVIDCAPFWKIESNLLSFFFSLPDDREQLTQLLDFE